MYLESAIKCLPCSQRFSETRKPCRGSCTHIICVPCKKKLKESFECPICDRVGAFKDVEPNYAALELAKQLQDKLRINDLWAFMPTEEDITMGPCSECSEHSRKLRLCTECAEKEGLIRKFEGKWILITRNADYEREFLKIKSRAICSHCAMDGAHEGHKIEVFFDALKHNFVTKESFYKHKKEKDEFSSLKRILERSNPKASEVQELEAIRAKFPAWMTLTEEDLSEIDERIRGKMIGLVEDFEEARKVDQNELDEWKEAVVELQLHDDEACDMVTSLAPNAPLDRFNEVTQRSLETGYNLTYAHVECSLAFQQVQLNLMVPMYMWVIAVRLRQLPFFNQLPIEPFRFPSHYLNDFTPPNLRI